MPSLHHLPAGCQALPIAKVVNITIILIAACAYSTLATACFSDENWAQLQSGSRATLVYVWSPRMVLSAHNAATALAAADAQGVQFAAVHDGRLAGQEIIDALAQLAQHPDPKARASAAALQATQPLCSPLLVDRDALRHFPTAWVVQRSDGKVLPKNDKQHYAIVGAMPDFAWDLSLRQRLHQP